MAYEEGIQLLIGKTITDFTISKDNDEIIFETSDGKFKMYHSQDCCESVSIEDIDGDLLDLVGNEILEASERESNNEDENNPDEEDEYGSHTYTFYVIRTLKASVTIRWYGSSNGYYSESVSFIKLD